jgi:hypothetical protein
VDYVDTPLYKRAFWNLACVTADTSSSLNSQYQACLGIGLPTIFLETDLMINSFASVNNSYFSTTYYVNELFKNSPHRDFNLW